MDHVTFSWAPLELLSDASPDIFRGREEGGCCWMILEKDFFVGMFFRFPID